jgi:hypothetical protein
MGMLLIAMAQAQLPGAVGLLGRCEIGKDPFLAPFPILRPEQATGERRKELLEGTPSFLEKPSLSFLLDGKMGCNPRMAHGI